jgi:hypothetical protein
MIPDYRSGDDVSDDQQATETTRRLRETLFLLAGFGAVLVAAGHGIVPLALIAVYAWPLPAMRIAWAGAALTVLRLVPGMRFTRALAASGIVCLLISWIMIMRYSEDLRPTIVSSLPFLYLAIRYSRLTFGPRSARNGQ